MHELSIMQSILDIAVDYALKNNANKITKINLEIGELTGFVTEWMQRYFDSVSEGTIAENAEVVIELKPAIIKCNSCRSESRITKESILFECPVCSSISEVEIISGKEYHLVSIEVD